MIAECLYCRSNWMTDTIPPACPRCGAPSPMVRQTPLAAGMDQPAAVGYLQTQPMPQQYPPPGGMNPYSPGVMVPQTYPGQFSAPMPGPYPAQYPPTYAPHPMVVVQNVNTNVAAPPLPVLYRERKSPGLAVAISWFFPGGGQFYNGEVGKGLLMMLGFWTTIWFGVGLGFSIWSMADAYSTAKKINQGMIV